MDDSIDFDQESWKERRTRALGYKPQHELFHNFYLPYSEKLDVESAELLDQIKQELGKTLAMREINPGTGIYVTKLMR
jgi:proteasome activator subunit 4